MEGAGVAAVGGGRVDPVPRPPISPFAAGLDAGGGEGWRAGCGARSTGEALAVGRDALAVASTFTGAVWLTDGVAAFDG
jgi:hypothetical protein